MMPYYRLKELIIKKYGDSNRAYATGCQLTAQFVGLGSKAKWTAAFVLNLCCTTTHIYISIDDKVKLMNLFHLKDPEELYTKQEFEPTVAEYFTP